MKFSDLIQLKKMVVTRNERIGGRQVVFSDVQMYSIGQWAVVLKFPDMILSYDLERFPPFLSIIGAEYFAWGSNTSVYISIQ